MSASLRRALLLLLLLAALAAGCSEQPSQPPPPSPPVVEVEGVRQAFALPPRGGPVQPLLAQLRQFAGGRMDALHVALPPGPAAAGLAWQLRVAGVMPRKIRHDPALIGARAIVAERYVAFVAPCPALDLTGGAFGTNRTRPGFGCAYLADLAAQTSDPADLLGNDAAPPPYADRATLPVARWLGFSAGGGSGGGSAAASSSAPSSSVPTTAAASSITQ